MSVMLSQQPKVVNPEVEAFLQLNPVQPHAASQLRNLPLHLQQKVLLRGSLASARDKTAVLTSRISDALASNAQGLAMSASAPMQGTTTVHPGIETMITQYNIDSRCAQMLRALPPDKQARAAELPLHEARNPSAFVMAQIQLLFGLPGDGQPALGGPLGVPPPLAPGAL